MFICVAKLSGVKEADPVNSSVNVKVKKTRDFPIVKITSQQCQPQPKGTLTPTA